MLTLEEIRARLENHNLYAVANAVGIHHNSMYRLMAGTSNPSYETVKKLSDYIKKEAKGSL